MYSSNSLSTVRMRLKGQRSERRILQPKNSQEGMNIEREVDGATARLPALLYRKDSGTLVVRLSELTLMRLADGVDIPQATRNKEIQLNLRAHLERGGLIDPRVVRRLEDRLSIIEAALKNCIELGVIEAVVRRREIKYHLSIEQMKIQKRAQKAHDRLKREERAGRKVK